MHFKVYHTFKHDGGFVVFVHIIYHLSNLRSQGQCIFFSFAHALCKNPPPPPNPGCIICRQVSLLYEICGLRRRCLAWDKTIGVFVWFLKVAAITVTVRYSYSMAWELETNKMELLKLLIFTKWSWDLSIWWIFNVSFPSGCHHTVREEQ
jgi:hypothetical protein